MTRVASDALQDPRTPTGDDAGPDPPGEPDFAAVTTSEPTAVHRHEHNVPAIAAEDVSATDPAELLVTERVGLPLGCRRGRVPEARAKGVAAVGPQSRRVRIPNRAAMDRPETDGVPRRPT